MREIFETPEEFATFDTACELASDFFGSVLRDDIDKNARWNLASLPWEDG